MSAVSDVIFESRPATREHRVDLTCCAWCSLPSVRNTCIPGVISVGVKVVSIKEASAKRPTAKAPTSTEILCSSIAGIPPSDGEGRDLP